MGDVMKVEASALKAALAAVRPAVDSKGASPLMGYAHVVIDGERVIVAANRNTVTMEARIRAPQDNERCVFVAPHDRLSQIVGLYDGETLALSYRADRKALTIKAARASHVLTCADPGDWPAVDWSAAPPGGEAPTPVILSAAAWAHVWPVAGYASTDDNRYGLNGVRLERTGDGETLRVAATDGSRLAWRSAQAEPTIPISGASMPRGTLIPREMAGVLGRVSAAAGADDLFALTVGERVAVWSQVDADGNEIGAVRLRFALVQGEFPDYRLVLPQSVKRTCVIKVSALSSALKSVAVSATDKNASVRCAFEEGRVLLSAQDGGGKGGEARAEVEAEFDGVALSTGFNATYLEAVLRGAAGDSVVVHMGDALDPSIWLDNLWRPGSGPLRDVADLVVIMPMRLD
jgi:DNA polymerase-3 subunit beta